MKTLISSANLSDNTLANLENRDVALWVHGLPIGEDQREAFLAFLGLPWRLVMLEDYDRELIAALDLASSVDDPLSRKRGLIQIVDSDPSRIELPPRCLPVYLLDGRRGSTNDMTFENMLRRLTMLESFRRTSVRELLVVSASANLIPEGFSELWSAGFRTQLTFVSDSSLAEANLGRWFDESFDVGAVNLIQLPTLHLIRETLSRYSETYPSDRRIIRMRDSRGQIHKVDITSADEIERPILDHYSLIEERDLKPLIPDDVSQEDFIAFFKNPEQSWRPYAASLPWVRDARCSEQLRKCLRDLDVVGPDENRIAFIASESGAGGTTLARALAWDYARQGYPVLVAKSYPFVPEPLPVVNFLTRAHRLFSEQTENQRGSENKLHSLSPDLQDNSADRRFETPWIILFDTSHWQHRDAELIQFRHELTRSGRPACLLVVTGTMLELSFYNKALFTEIAELNHAVTLNEARELGRHLNRFLRIYGRERSQSQWDKFYEEHTVRYLEGQAAFWVALSFWIQGQYDLSESMQEWVYKSFKKNADDLVIQQAVLQIAAMSSERLPIPQSLLPRTRGRWPVWQLIEDRASDLANLGLTQVVAQGERYWALVHDILGRLLINALFYDYPMREALGFSRATEPEHLRFLILRRISENPTLGERAYRSIGEDFATEVFKVDPDHGKSSFVSFWPEVLDALDNMPQLLRDTSRVFRHHAAVSRRRIAKLSGEFYGLENADRVALLRRAVDDINYALNEIPYSTGTESNLNLLNSLARAYLDLAEIESEMGASPAHIAELRRLASDTTRRAYRESPNNSFVIETYVESLLQGAHATPSHAAESCIEALGVLYSALHSGNENNRASHLGRLADQALKILFQQVPTDTLMRKPGTEIDVLVHAWLVLAESRPQRPDWSLEDIPIQNQEKALGVLAGTAGGGNNQILLLRYDLTCNCYPYEFKRQLELLEPLHLSDYWMSPQLQLEYAILLFQTGRANEGDRAFRALRRLWQTSEQFVTVPDRLRWLLSAEERKPQIVKATIGSEFGTRAFALVREFGNARVPFRPEEHGFTDLRTGQTFSCYVTFGYNGPFLRPLSSRPPTFS